MEYLEATLKLGLPVMIMSWWVHSWLYRNRLIDPAVDRRETEKAVNKYRKFKKNKGSDKQAGDFLTAKWLRFGGGFYGLTALWTLIVLEAQEVLSLLTNFQAVIGDLPHGIVAVMSAFIQNQITNIAKAFTWVVNWTEGFSLIWFFVPYIGYYLGMQLAKLRDIKTVLLQLRQGQ